jgi:hypothetical protein
MSEQMPQRRGGVSRALTLAGGGLVAALYLYFALRALG